MDLKTPWRAGVVRTTRPDVVEFPETDDRVGFGYPSAVFFLWKSPRCCYLQLLYLFVSLILLHLPRGMWNTTPPLALARPSHVLLGGARVLEASFVVRNVRERVQT